MPWCPPTSAPSAPTPHNDPQESRPLVDRTTSRPSLLLVPAPRPAAALAGPAGAKPGRPDNPPPPDFARQSESLVRSIPPDIPFQPSARGATVQSALPYTYSPPPALCPSPPRRSPALFGSDRVAAN